MVALMPTPVSVFTNSIAVNAALAGLEIAGSSPAINANANNRLSSFLLLILIILLH